MCAVDRSINRSFDPYCHRSSVNQQQQQQFVHSRVTTDRQTAAVRRFHSDTFGRPPANVESASVSGLLLAKPYVCRSANSAAPSIRSASLRRRRTNSSLLHDRRDAGFRLVMVRASDRRFDTDIDDSDESERRSYVTDWLRAASGPRG